MFEPTTLDELMSRRADTLSPQDLEALVAGLREQRTRWLANQATGSRKLVRAKDVKTTPAIAIDLSAMKPTSITL